MTGKKILSAETVKEMFTNQIPQFSDFGRVPIAAAKPDLTLAIPELYAQPPEQEQGWGLTFFQTIHPGATGRAAKTVHWAGIANLWWWCDREKGVAGMICAQILPFGGKFCNDSFEKCLKLNNNRCASSGSVGYDRVCGVQRHSLSPSCERARASSKRTLQTLCLVVHNVGTTCRGPSTVIPFIAHHLGPFSSYANLCSSQVHQFRNRLGKERGCF